MASAISLKLAAPAPLEARSVHVHEALSAPFEVALTCASIDPSLDAEAFVGGDARVAIDRGALGARSWAGVCTGFHALAGGDVAGVYMYAVHVAPRAAVLEHRRDHRAFTNMSAPDIAKAIFASAGLEVELRLGAAYPALPFRAQRGETDLAFVERVLEEAGITYAFEPTTTRGEPDTKVALIDAPERAEVATRLAVVGSADPAAREAFATAVRSKVALRPGAIAQAGHDFKRPRFHPVSRAARAARGEARLEIARFGVASSTSDATRDAAAESALAGARQDRSVTTFTTNVCSLGPASGVTLRGHDGDLVVLRTKLTWREHAPLEVEVAAAPNDAPIRPMTKAERPRAPAVESAFVDGPDGAEIHADEHGRVQLRFPWDTNAAPGTGPWARLDAPFTGAGFGGSMLPRVGDEVLVGYLHGDPDEPIIIGRLHNAESAVTHPLPHGAAKTGLLTATTGDTSGGGHELTFDDTSGSELVRLRSAGDLSMATKNDERARVAGHASAMIGSRSLTVGDSEALTVGRQHEVRMAEVKDLRPGSAAGPDLAALPTRREIVGQRITLSTGGATIVLDGPDIVVSADHGVNIRAGGVVSIQGEPHVHLNPPIANAKGGDDAAAPASDHVVWFKLHTEGVPVAGVRVHVTEDTPAPGAETVMSRVGETDGSGQVRLPVPAAGSHTVTVAKGSTAVPEGVPVAKVSSQPTPNASPTSHELPVVIEVISPKHGDLHHLHTKPSMPSIPIEAKVTLGGKVIHEGHVGWTFGLEGHYRVRQGLSGYREQAYDMRAGHAMTTPGERKDFELAPSELLGGNLSVEVHFSGGEALGGVRGKKTVGGMRVLGANPERADVDHYIAEHAGNLAWALMRLFCFESLHQLAQFARASGGDNTPGWPLYGPPSGVGIVQRDPSEGDWRFPKSRRAHANNFFPRIFWDWRKRTLSTKASPPVQDQITSSAAAATSDSSCAASKSPVSRCTRRCAAHPARPYSALQRRHRVRRSERRRPPLKVVAPCVPDEPPPMWRTS